MSVRIPLWLLALASALLALWVWFGTSLTPGWCVAWTLAIVIVWLVGALIYLASAPVFP